ncbi:MAG: hypothetical protein GVY19_03790 [Bacteroidetes bacterium]|jgi:hypothetical protein|nr:hypothetical protein [Bacteroidota bacterium]
MKKIKPEVNLAGPVWDVSYWKNTLRIYQIVCQIVSYHNEKCMPKSGSPIEVLNGRTSVDAQIACNAKEVEARGR